MSALAFLSGLASGAGEEMSKQGEQKRSIQANKDSALAETINKRLETDNTLDWPTYSSLREQEYKLRGIKPADSQQLLGHEKGIWDQHVAPTRQPTGPTPSAGSPDLSGEASGPQSSSLPPVPQAPTTSGDIRSSQSVRSATQAGQAAEDLKIDTYKKQMALMGGGGAGAAGQSGIDESGNHYINEVRMTPTGPSQIRKADLGRPVAGMLSGEAATKQFPNAVTQNGQPPDPQAFYRAVRYGNNDVSLFATTPPVNRTLIQDPASSTGYYQVLHGPTGSELGREETLPPPGLVSKTTEGDVVEWKLNPATGQYEPFHVKSTRTTTPNLAPAGGGPTGALPTATHTGVKTPIPSASSGSFVSPKGQPSVDPQVAYLTGQVASGRIPIDKVKGDGVKLTDKQMRGAVQSNLAALGLDINKITQAQWDTSKFASTVETHLPTIMSDIDTLDKAGLLGPIAGRFNEFMAGDFGSLPTNDPKLRDTYLELRDGIGLLQTALMKIHTGSRGSTVILDKFDKLINSKKMDGPTLAGAIKGTIPWIHTYAQMAPTGAEALQGGPGRGMGTPTGQPPGGPAPIIQYSPSTRAYRYSTDGGTTWQAGQPPK